MPQGFGRNSFIGWGEENPWGTPVAGTKWAELVSEKLETIRDRVPRNVVRGLNPRESNMYDRLFGVKGPFGVEINYAGMLRLWNHLLGDASVTTVVTEGGVRWTHTGVQKATVMSGKGLTLHLHQDVDAGSLPELRAYGYKLNSAKFTFKPDANAMVEFDGVGKDADRVAASSPAFPTPSLYVAGHQMSCEFDDVVRAVDEIEFTYDNGLDTEKRVLGSKNIAEPIRSATRASCAGTITVDALQADWSKLDAGSLFKLEILHAGPALGAGNYRFDVTLLKCLVTGNPFNVQDGGVVKSTIPFVALEPTSGEIITIVCVNNESAVA